MLNRTKEPSAEPRAQVPEAARNRAMFWIWIAALFALLLWFGGKTAGGVQTIRYSEFKQHLARGDVLDAVVGETRITGKLGGGSDTGDEVPAAVRFRCVRLEDADLVQDLESAGIPFTGAPRNAFSDLLFAWILPFGLMVLVLVLMWLFGGMARRAGGQMLGFGKSRAKLVAEEGTGVTFEDVAGCDEAKVELGQMVECLRNPGRFTALGGRIPKGVLLLGPPGTGKTLLARAIAGEAGVPFFSLSGSEFVEMFVGVGAARVRDLFEQAKARAPCIVFIDEIDAIGRQRGISMGVVNDEREQTLNQLLAEMDGFENNAGVILLAATNRPEILDRALLRPGRFDRQVVLDAPDIVGREAILAVHVRGKPLAADVELGRIARVTPGMAGADLANVVNEAALIAADRHAVEIAERDLLEAVERVVAGPERRSRRLEPAEKRRVAYHESGHALVASRVEHGDRVQKVTIVPRGRAALGYTMQLPDHEHYLRTKNELMDRLAVLLGGRTAEELVFADVSSGAQDDLRGATDIARQMVCLLGMSDRVGLGSCARLGEGAYLTPGAMVRDCSERTSRTIDEEVRALLELARDRARSILEAERGCLERIAQELLDRETLDRPGLERILESGSASSDSSREGHSEEACGTSAAIAPPSP